MNDSFRSAASRRSNKSNNIYNNFDPDLPNDDEDALSQSSYKSSTSKNSTNKGQNKDYVPYNQQGQWNNQPRPQRFNNNNNYNNNYNYQNNNNYNGYNNQKFQNNHQGYTRGYNQGYNQYPKPGYDNYNNNYEPQYNQHGYGHGHHIKPQQLYANQRDHFPTTDIAKELGQTGTQNLGFPMDQSFTDEINDTMMAANRLGVDKSLIGFGGKNKGREVGLAGKILSDKEKESKRMVENTKFWFLKAEKTLMHNVDNIVINRMLIKPECSACTIKRFVDLDMEKEEFPFVEKQCKVCFEASKNVIMTSLARVFEKFEDEVIFAKISTTGALDIKLKDIEKFYFNIECAGCGKQYPLQYPPGKDDDKHKKKQKDKAEGEVKGRGDDKGMKKRFLEAKEKEKAAEKEKLEENNEDDNDDVVLSYNVACSTWNCYNLLIFEAKRLCIANKDFSGDVKEKKERICFRK